jgi:hypothetical protein
LCIHFLGWEFLDPKQDFLCILCLHIQPLLVWFIHRKSGGPSIFFLISINQSFVYTRQFIQQFFCHF